MTDVTIIIVNYNTVKLTIDCINSIRKSDPKLTYEVIVVDNGSTDGSVAAIRNYQLSIINFQLKLIENRKNVGFAKANNQGVENAKGKYILLLNSDTKVKDKAIDSLVKFAKETPDCGAAVPKLLYTDGSSQGSVFKFPTITRTIAQYWFGEGNLLTKYVPKSKKPIAVEVASMAAFLIAPKAIKKVGLLDERYFMYFEDFDYCKRVKEAGLKVYYLPGAKVVHHHGASGKNIIEPQLQWKRLVPSSKIYHGWLKHTLIFLVIWIGQKFQDLVKRK